MCNIIKLLATHFTAKTDFCFLSNSNIYIPTSGKWIVQERSRKMDGRKKVER
jgi:type VI protein secretion system component VasK